MIAKQIRVEGLVQGVGFRWSAAAEAQMLGVAGWVRNEADGSVTAWAQGEAGQLDAFLRWMGHGPPGARVLRCGSAERTPDAACRGFSIRHGGET
jgi:acylphosphatase